MILLAVFSGFADGQGDFLFCLSDILREALILMIVSLFFIPAAAIYRQYRKWEIIRLNRK